MTELTEREQQIVAWLRAMAHSRYCVSDGAGEAALEIAATAIERGEPWGEQA